MALTSSAQRNKVDLVDGWRRGATLGKRTDRVIACLLAACLLHLAGALGVSAEEFRTPSISAVRVEWRAVLDQLRSEIGSQPSVASAFTFATQRRGPPPPPRFMPPPPPLNASSPPPFNPVNRRPPLALH